MSRQIFSFKIGIFIASLFISTALFANHWRVLTEGIAYKDYGPNLFSPWSHIHVFDIDLQHHQFDLATARDLSKSLASVNELGDTHHALLAINGGFFDENSQPLGLRIGNHKQHNALKPISWWGIFYIKHQTAHITNYKRFHPSPYISFAVQSGPRLLVNGKMLHLKEGIAERSALGIAQNGHVIVLVTQNSPITTMALAELMKTELHCKDALNLDGGSSSQLFTHIGDFRINAYGFSNISDAIIIKPR